jgi:LacI family transcriptional regulator
MSTGKRRAPITLKELAERAGVHPSTISRVANQDPGLRIAPATRERIQTLLRDTQYRPNGIARSLKLRRSFVLGVIVPDVTNPFFAALYRGVEDGALPRGFNVILCNTDGRPERERSQLQMLRERRVDGVILASTVLHDPSVAWLRAEGVPHVLVNRYTDEEGAFVGSDDVVGGRMVTEHLLKLGHRRIGHLSGLSVASTGVLRLRGYRDALEAAGIEYDPGLVVEAGYMEEGGRQAGRELLGRNALTRPTAVFAVNDLVALGLYSAARELGLRVPADLAVVGYNDIPTASRVQPSLTTVRVPVHEFGVVGAALLIDQVTTGERAPRRVVFKPELVVRESSAAPTV